MQFSSLSISDVKLIEPKHHLDARGSFTETFKSAWFRENIAAVDFVQDNQSLSHKSGTVRGLHYQRAPMAQAKLVRVLSGAIIDVAVDLRTHSPTFGKHVAARLDAIMGAQLYIPIGFAHGFITLAPDTIVNYKVSAPYSPRDEGGVYFADPALNIAWGIAENAALLSDKDRLLPMLKDATL